MVARLLLGSGLAHPLVYFGLLSCPVNFRCGLRQQQQHRKILAATQADKGTTTHNWHVRAFTAIRQLLNTSHDEQR